MDNRTESHRVPYFRYFGPTAIVPGFKQMVVNVSVHRDRRRSRGGSFSAVSPGSILGHTSAEHVHPSMGDTVLESLEDLPIYDPNDPTPVHPLIINLLRTFFLRLGCNCPFLREEKVLRMAREKRIEPILVDSMCALAARFSEMSVFTNESDGKVARSEFGHIFAQRAKAATVDTFPCPSVGAVQACLLMAYEGFGANQDSALWMYLGLAIRMAVDLGLQKTVGVKYQGEKDPWYARTWNRSSSDGDINEIKETDDGDGGDDDPLSPEEQMEVEQERIDTFWAVFVLDRVISSGTGRPVTFRDNDFDLALPEPTVDPVSGWPAPFPTFIRIIHLYGRVSDVLNNIRDANDLTQEKMAKLAQMESDLTQIYQKQDPRLNFSAQNFQEYVKAGQGTTFILLHFWFHALIIILHQPTLLAPFGGLSRIRLLPNSHELSMSSAKTISDILAFAELIDPKSFIGNPFTSQPMYIAACAFLMESVTKDSGPPSPHGSPRPDAMGAQSSSGPGDGRPPGTSKSVKHSLLTSTANQNYQRCYKSLQHLNDYWGGVKYILTALDQKSKGIWDCETYTNEEYESAKFTRRTSLSRLARLDNPSSPNIVPMAFSLTGTTNSPNPSLTLLYQNNFTTAPQTQQSAPTAPMSAPTPPGNMIYDPIRQSLPETPNMYPPAYPQPNLSAMRHHAHPSSRMHRLSTSSMGSSHLPGKSHLKYESLANDDLDQGPNDSKLQMLAGMPQGNHQHQPQGPPSYTPSSQHSSNYEASIVHGASPASTLTDSGQATHPGQQHQHQHQQQHNNVNGNNANPGGGMHGGYHADFPQSGLMSGSYSYLGPVGITDVITLDSQEIDLGQLGLTNDVMPTTWLEYLPDNVLELFEGNVSAHGPGHHM